MTLIMYEHHTHKLLPWRPFLRRAARHLVWSILLVVAAVVGGTTGYHVLGGLPWIDALLNASILGGIGPVDPLRTTAGKLFASFYALYSGLAIIIAMTANVFVARARRGHTGLG